MVLPKNVHGKEAKGNYKRIMNLRQQFQEPFSSQARISTTNRHHHRNNQWPSKRMDEGEDVYMKQIEELEELFSKLNPMAQEFVPPSRAVSDVPMDVNGGCASAADAMDDNGLGNSNGSRGPRGVKKWTNSRTSMAQREEKIRRTVYVSDIDQKVTEEQLATLFSHCGQVVDCRVCGDPRSVLRFAFVEFTDQESARVALSLFGTVLGYYPVKVSPSKTAIAPVNPTFLPQTSVEREMCSRTVYVTNIDKKVSQTKVKLYFESLCGEVVYRLRLLGDNHHCSRIAFVEFVAAESAIAALNCTGVMLGSLPIRVSPSKTPVRAKAHRPKTH
ncbi:Polyadenylate-binding protein-interacting protein 12 [Striga hermonthica]|uniref:Polyadenylate-binding protein-interacting protein 12 n=1 Tax=Striga hermonthica TaxID=68872 RepID=A0A9N7P491_STRHE|nr:Polyadenylate-binding protein-interacting protein 12 [Striga hermonthica]